MNRGGSELIGFDEGHWIPPSRPVSGGAGPPARRQLAYHGPDGTLTYRELDERSTALALSLLEKLGSGAQGFQQAAVALLAAAPRLPA